VDRYGQLIGRQCRAIDVGEFIGTQASSRRVVIAPAAKSREQNREAAAINAVLFLASRLISRFTSLAIFSLSRFSIINSATWKLLRRSAHPADASLRENLESRDAVLAVPFAEANLRYLTVIARAEGTSCRSNHRSATWRSLPEGPVRACESVRDRITLTTRTERRGHHVTVSRVRKALTTLS